MKALLAVACVLAMSLGHTATAKVNGNAALIYWQAFDGLEEISGEDYRGVMELPPDQRLNDELVQRFEKRRHTLKLMHRASMRTYCDWGIEFDEDGAEAILPHLSLARGMARLALLRARHNFAVGKESEAITDVLAVMTMARHAGRDRSLVGMLVDQRIQMMAHEVTAAYIPKLSKEALAQLESGIAKLPEPNSFATCMVTEREFGPWLIRSIEATSNEEELNAFFELMGVEALADVVRESGKEGLIQHARELLDLYDVLPGLVARPDQGEVNPFRDVLNEATKNPVGKLLFPALDKAWRAHQAFKCQDAMFRSGLAVIQRGDAVLEQYRDPTDGGTFEKADVKGGFELRSKFRSKPDSSESMNLKFGVIN